MTEEESPTRAPGYRTGRMEAFSDGVFAIALAGVQIVDVNLRITDFGRVCR